MRVIAHDIRSMHNVGAIFRSCDAFGVERLYLTGYTAFPPRPEIAKVSLGAEDRVPWEADADIARVVARLRADGYRVVALENGVGAGPIGPMDGKVAIMLGNETEGIDRDALALADETVEIPMPGRKKSLNVSVAAGIALFAVSKKSG
jgi:tRNA G18 (ribose-2'-O)-methylase SpoU